MPVRQSRKPGNAIGGSRASRFRHIVLVVAAALTGCAVPPPTRQPMDIHVFLAPEGGGEEAVIFLPGRRDSPLDFVDNGFLEALRERHPEADAFIPDAHFGFYAGRSVVNRLHEDLFAPLRGRGYRRIHVVGVSMGGLGALLYAQRHPEQVDGLALLAPYLGEPRTIQRVRAAGGPTSWTGPAPSADAGLGELAELWGWFSQWPRNPPAMPVVLAYGEQDRFAPANAMLAEVLPSGRTLTMEGGHRWAVWARLWRALLSRGVIDGIGETRQAKADR